MVLCLPDGTIYDVWGPFYADGHHNDEMLLEACLDKASCGIRTKFDPSIDAFFADRGFTRCRPADTTITQLQKDAAEDLDVVQQQLQQQSGKAITII